MPSTPRWGLFQLELRGPAGGNPFVGVTLGARFEHDGRTVQVQGFYDGDGIYRVRFMPDAPGPWRYVTESNCPDLGGRTGAFQCTAPEPGHHGPVRVADTFHFAYADGTPYTPVGTTAYAWIHQDEDLQRETLATLAGGPFNKLRMLLFPKDYTYCRNEPRLFPLEGRGPGAWDYARFNPAFFRHLEGRIEALGRLGIEADLILFHPYDRWGFSSMPAEADDRYLRYVVARLAAYRNVWWSLANEYDFLKTKTPADWDRFFQIVQQGDPYAHLRSIHNGVTHYDHAKPWVTHASIQHGDAPRPQELAHWREAYRKPVVIDENRYEGNLPYEWGCLPARELVHRFWLATVGGAYGGHSETYLHPQDRLWWCKGGVLRGESPPRLAFLRKILEEGPPVGFSPVSPYSARQRDDVYLYYFGNSQPAEWDFVLPEAITYNLQIIDPWAMTLSPAGTFRGTFRMLLPGKPYLAVRAIRVE
jgi:hypothetical protein